MKKIIAMLLALLMVLSMTACAAEEQPAEQKPENQAPVSAEKEEASSQEESFEGKTLTLLMNLNDNSNADAAYAQIAAFEQKYGCTVDVEAAPGSDEGENLKRVRLATGGLADVYMMTPGSKLDEFDPVNNMLDISGEPWVDNIADGYRQVVTYDGGVYATPSDTSNAAGVIYNVKVFEQLSMEVPTTWEEFLQCCETMKAAGITPMAGPYSKTSNTQIPFLMNYYYVQDEDPEFINKYVAKECELSDSPAFMRGLQKLYDVANLGYLYEDSLSLGMEECAAMLGAGEIGMMIIRTNILSTMNTVCPDKINDVDFFPLPDVDGSNRGVCYWLPMGYVINKDAKEPELAKKWCEFVVSQEGIDAYCSVTIPAGTFMAKNIVMPENAFPALVTAQEWLDKASSPVMEYFCKIKGSNQASICSMLAMASITPEEAVAQISEDNAVDAQQKGIWE